MKNSLIFFLLVITVLNTHGQGGLGRGDNPDFGVDDVNLQDYGSDADSVFYYNGYDTDGFVGREYDYGSASGDDDNEARGTYTITFKAKYKSALQDDLSQQFERVAGDIHRSLLAYITEELGVPEDGFEISVLSLEPEPLSRNKKIRATVDIQFESFSGMTSEELTEVMLSFPDTGRIGRKKVTAVTEVVLETETSGIFLPEMGDGDDENVIETAPVDYNVVINYQRQFDPLLADITSSAFQLEKRAVEQEVNLFLLAGQSIDRNDIVGVSVEEFQPMNGESTGAFLTISLFNTPPQRLDAALKALVGESLSSKWPIVSAELNGLPTSSVASTSTDEPVPPAELPDGGEPLPPDVPNPPTSPPNRGDTGDEPLPPDVPNPSTSPPNRGDTDNEPIPPDYTDEPTPPVFEERPDHCRSVQSLLEYGSVTCTGGNSIGSICQFECNPGTALQGASQITCQADGEWDESIPICDEIFCQSSLSEEGVENGRVTCSDGVRLGSQCIYDCSEGYKLSAAEGDELTPFRTCLENEEWSGTKPVCEIISFDCEISFREWSDCASGLRTREGYIVKEAVGNGKPCPSPVPYKEEACQHCVVDWGDWGECRDGKRSRSEVAVVPHAGAGEPCPVLRNQTEPCVHCEVQWGNWSVCVAGTRTRNQYVAVEAVGDGAIPCLALQRLTEECRDCVVEWGDWEGCSDGLRVRHQFIAVRKLGAGKECPQLEREDESCVHCEVQWGEWGSCENGYRRRSEEISTPPIGAGNACPVLDTENEECRDCVLAWEEWSECSNGARSRTQYPSSPPVGAGETCSEPITQTEACVDCKIGWGDWSVCSGGGRRRDEVVVVEPVGEGERCPSLQSQSETCVHCEVEWEEWGECANGTRSRKQYITVEAVGPGGIPCLPLRTQEEECVHCEVGFGEWSECEGFERIRWLHVSVEPVGAGANPCPHLHEETEECYDCELAWDSWERCSNGERRRSQFVLIEQEGGGKPCEWEPEEVESCLDCQIAWGEWGECVDGQRVRKQEVVSARVGAGRPCPLLNTERQDCRNCIVGWYEWSECSEGLRNRSQYVDVQASEGGESCPTLQTQDEICIDCQVAWAGWSACADGTRVRFQYELVEKIGAGEECPEIQSDSEECRDCVLAWEEWSECSNGIRSRSQYPSSPPVGAGEACPELETEREACLDCEVAWLDWSPCANGNRTRNQFISREKVGTGNDCPELQNVVEACADCVVAWRDFGECSNGEMTQRQFVFQNRVGAGRPCPVLQTNTAACSDCVADWGEWSGCENSQKTRKQEIIIGQLGTGEACPELATQTKSCNETIDTSSVICRYVRDFLGYNGSTNRRDVLLLGDESGSIGWINYEKIKNHFKAVAREIRGGIGDNHAQLSMMSFAGWTRTQFGFDTYDRIDDIVKAIGRSTYQGGHRSKIGQALIEANTWMFQQAEGMRSFPGRDDDDITHEILIATDGCRTSSTYFLEKGLSKIRRRGIKLSVLGIDSHDPRCKEALREMLDGQTVLYEVGDWNDLDDFNRRIENKECQS